MMLWMIILVPPAIVVEEMLLKMEKLFLKREDAILVMIYYKWNKDKLDDWYDDIEGNKSKVGIELSDETKNTIVLYIFQNYFDLRIVLLLHIMF